MKKKLRNVIFFLIILLLLFMAVHAKSKKIYSIDNILIFNLYENSLNRNYTFDVSANANQTNHVNLYNTLNIDSLANEKIAPGTNGQFSITITASQKLNYEIKFESLNIKPKNLCFKLKSKSPKYSSLEELEKYLKGVITKDETKKFFIEWSWEYEINDNANIQDTLDGINIKEYIFDINVISNEI